MAKMFDWEKDLVPAVARARKEKKAVLLDFFNPK